MAAPDGAVLRAHVVYEKDKDYVVERGQRTGEMEVVIVDEYTGRKMVGRQWSDGLHQAVEAKERVPIKQETQTLATITLQNFFKLYKALAGMTGTAQTEAEEFTKIYKLEVVTIPTNRPVIREDNEDRVYRTERGEVGRDHRGDQGGQRRRPAGARRHDQRREERDALASMLKQKYGIEHEVLNAKHHEREAQIVADRRPAAQERPRRDRRQRHDRHEHGRPRHRHQAVARSRTRPAGCT